MCPRSNSHSDPVAAATLPGPTRAANSTMADANPLAKYSNLTSLKGKVVMITGASSGIGEACAWRFAAEGEFACMPGTMEPR
jgi:hypothetical protein